MTLHMPTHSISHSLRPSSQALRKAGATPPPAPAANLAVMQ